MLFPPKTRADLIRELENDEQIAGICVAHGPAGKLLMDEFAEEFDYQKVTVIVLLQKREDDDDVED